MFELLYQQAEPSFWESLGLSRNLVLLISGVGGLVTAYFLGRIRLNTQHGKELNELRLEQNNQKSDISKLQEEVRGMSKVTDVFFDLAKDHFVKMSKKQDED